MDWMSYLLIIVASLITLLASIYIKVNYSKYNKVSIKSGKTGFDVAREILDRNGLNNILVLETEGELTDHYDPSKKVIKLSYDIYHGKSIASASVSAHECGHALQDKDGYSFLRLRNKIAPIVNLSSKLGYVAILLGIVFSLVKLMWLGIIFEVIILLFQLITLPVEFNASRRALKIINEMGFVDKDELKGSKKMLISAALTYVASVISNILEIVRLLLMANNRRR